MKWFEQAATEAFDYGGLREDYAAAMQAAQDDCLLPEDAEFEPRHEGEA